MMSPLALGFVAALATACVFGAIVSRGERTAILPDINTPLISYPRRYRFLQRVPVPRKLIDAIATKERLAKIGNEIELAGNPLGLDGLSLISLSLSIFFGVLGIGAILAVLHPAVLLIFLIAAVVFSIAPYGLIHHRALAIRRQIDQQIPQLFDLLVLADSAGQTEVQGLTTAAERLPAPLGPLLQQTLAAHQAAQATPVEVIERIANLSGSTPLDEFATTLRLNEAHGGKTYAATISAQAERLRTARQALLEKKVQQLITMLIVPIGAFFLPAIMLLILGGQINTLIKGFARI